MGVVDNILSLVFNLESGNNFNKWNPQTEFLPKKPLTEMTIGEIMSVQESNFDNNGGAAGAGQIKHGTFETLINNKVLTKDDIFDEGTQRRAHEFLLNRRGLDKYTTGKISAEEFGNRLAKEYASLPVITGDNRGKSYYFGKAGNKALALPETVLDVLGREDEKTGIAGLFGDDTNMNALLTGMRMFEPRAPEAPLPTLGLRRRVRGPDPLSSFGIGSLGKEFM